MSDQVEQTRAADVPETFRWFSFVFLARGGYSIISYGRMRLDAMNLFLMKFKITYFRIYILEHHRNPFFIHFGELGL